jgi:hypothetical protein
VSRFGRFFSLVEYLSRYTQNKIGIAIGVPTLSRIADETFYDDLPGGALEAAGRMFRRNVRLYVYPTRDKSGSLITLENVTVAPSSRPLFRLLSEGGFLIPIRDYNLEYLGIDHEDVVARLRSGAPGWEAMVPAAVAETIKREHLFGWEPR